MIIILKVKPLAVAIPPITRNNSVILLMGQKALCKIAAAQEQNKSLGITNGASMTTTQTVG